MEKLGQLARAGDAVGPDRRRHSAGRSALDFLDAPQRLGSFLDGRLIRLLGIPARAGGRAYFAFFEVGFGTVTSAFTKVLGGELLA